MVYTVNERGRVKKHTEGKTGPLFSYEDTKTNFWKGVLKVQNMSFFEWLASFLFGIPILFYVMFTYFTTGSTPGA